LTKTDLPTHLLAYLLTHDFAPDLRVPLSTGLIRAALESEGATPRDLADTLAEMKARKIAEKEPAAMCWAAIRCWS
jgi:hypothetical protein